MSRSRVFSFACIASLALVTATSASLFAAKAKNAEEAGAVLFRDKGCTYCHGAAGTGGKRGPDLTTLRTDKLWPADKIARQIRDGGQKMPPFGDSLTNEEIAQLIALLRAKHWITAPPAAAQ